MEYQPRASVVHKSLLENKTIAGVEKEIAVFNGTVAFAVCYGTQSLWYLPFAVLLHMGIRWMNKRDPHIRKIYLRFSVLGRTYDPWPRRKTTTNERPEGFSRGQLC